jgi:hypothetical protein
MRSIGYGEGPAPQVRKMGVRGESPSSGLLRNPTSPRKRGEVTQFNQTGRDQVRNMDCSIAGILGAKTRFALLPGHG